MMTVIITVSQSPLMPCPQPEPTVIKQKDGTYKRVFVTYRTAAKDC
jgi:hypothetical protein